MAGVFSIGEDRMLREYQSDGSVGWYVRLLSRGEVDDGGCSRIEV